MKQLLYLSILIFSIRPVLAVSSLNESILTEYLKIQKEFVSASCTPGTEETYKALDKNYRGDGNFIPILLDERVDLKTIRSLIPLMKEKNLWINSQIEFLKKLDNVKNIRFELDRIENDVALLQEAKKDYYFAGSKAKKEHIKEKAEKQFEQLLKEVELLKEQAPFLLSFKFPVNHLALRSEYEKNKFVLTKEARSRANSIYLFRKIIQDGSYDLEMTRNDSVIRSAFDTLYLSLNREPKRSFLLENERVDLKFILKNFEILLSSKTEVLIERFLEWRERNNRTMIFYMDILEGKKLKISENSQIQDVTTLLAAQARSLYTLKDFVLEREAKAYEYWSKKSDLFQSLYAIESILYSEVGRMDGNAALERRDVTQVVINRMSNPHYNFLSEKDSILRYFSPNQKRIDSKWLNVLFKEGEFSFTYFYIPGNFHIYCPDMSKVGQFLRRENIRIALEHLNKPRDHFKALRYFSRTSMFGRIEMDSLWDDFRPLPEVPGQLVKNRKKVYRLFKKDGYEFLYDFTNENLKKNFLVVNLKGETYVIDALNNKKIYYYRNPHQFKYFSLLK